MENKQNNSGLKAAVVVLALLFLGSLGYIFKMNSDNKKQVTELTTEKTSLENEIKAKIAELESMSNENNALKSDIDAQKAEMEKLLGELQKAKDDSASMRKYQGLYAKLNREFENLKAENELLKQQNVTLKSNLDSTNVVLDDAKRFNDTLVMQNDNLTKTVEKGSKLSVLNLNVLAVKERSSGKQI
ncbi:MAG: hypothetical protein KYX68_07205 [Flavobacterium sp.]|nr:hypothetical protein [Flavobacterium sp.]